MAASNISKELQDKFEIREWRHAAAVLMEDFSSEWSDIEAVLGSFRLKKSRIVLPGGSKSLIAGDIDRALTRRGWEEKQFATSIHVDETKIESPTHKVDCFKNKVGLEIEWNNKDPFFDRDLNNFRLLFDLRALSVGVIVTRCDSLQAIFKGLNKGSSYGNSTTHMSKLVPRLEGGGGGGCPVLVFGISDALYVDDIPDGEIATLRQEFDAARSAIKPFRGKVLSAQKRIAKWTSRVAESPASYGSERLEAARADHDSARAALMAVPRGAVISRYLDPEDLLRIAADDEEQE